MIRAMKKVLTSERKPQTIRSDQGGEYTGKKVQEFFKADDIHHMIAYNVGHANYADRVSRMIKGKIFGYLPRIVYSDYPEITLESKCVYSD